ncbi:MAG TPA: NAD(P)H-dependent oxidoreductase [Terriglobia bacterium]|nr:NAD(P)H-dependent oxidoreductase [Terriglobia bacterium]
MADKKVVILDGTQAGDENRPAILGVLSDVLKGSGAEIQTFTLRQMKIAHCLGCFGCWVETPGICKEADAGREIAKAVAQSDTTVFFTPVTFGGYSPELKRAVDRFIQLTVPYFEVIHGEIHHPPRYARVPRLVVVGVQRHPNEEEARIFRVLAGRNAINMHPASYAVEVIDSEDDLATLGQRFQALLSRSDAMPFGEAVTTLMPAPDASPIDLRGGTRRALLIVGSPKTRPTMGSMPVGGTPSTSGVLGSYLLERLKGSGWETESLTLRASLLRQDGQAELLSATDRADLIVLAFPLYVDALPFLVTKALDLIATRRRGLPHLLPQRLVAVVNNGFPEAYQNAVALAICHQFAIRSGISWAGGLALGGGESISSGRPLTDPHRSGPPITHVIRALDMTAAALAEGHSVPGSAVTMMARNPMPVVPFAVWRTMFVKFGASGFEQMAAENGVSKEQLLARPYAA